MKIECMICGRDFRDTPQLLKMAFEPDGHEVYVCIRCFKSYYLESGRG